MSSVFVDDKLCFTELHRIQVDNLDMLRNKNVRIGKKIAVLETAYTKLPILTLNAGSAQEAVAEKLRLEGNVFYASQCYEQSIESYNAALCNATSNTNRGIIYANRAAAFLALESYGDCLASVQLAKECPLPVNVLQKVMAREKMAIEQLQMESSYRNNSRGHTAELSYRRHKLVPSFTHCLLPKDYNNPFGGIVTSTNLLPGDVVAIEQPLAVSPGTMRYIMCSHCLQGGGKLQPCKCGWAMFCSAECKAQAMTTYHDLECPILGSMVNFPTDVIVMRMFFKLLKRFGDVASMRQYLKLNENMDRFSLPDSKEWPNLTSFESQFCLFYANRQPSLIGCKIRLPNMMRNDPLSTSPLVRAMICASQIITLLKRSKLPVASNDDEWMFVSELLCQLFFYKCFTIKTAVQEVRSRKLVGMAIYGSASLFRSSCQSNVQMDYANNILIVRAKQLIRRGAELLCDNDWSKQNTMSLIERFGYSSLNFADACYCEECHATNNLWIGRQRVA